MKFAFKLQSLAVPKKRRSRFGRRLGFLAVEVDPQSGTDSERRQLFPLDLLSIELDNLTHLSGTGLRLKAVFHYMSGNGEYASVSVRENVQTGIGGRAQFDCGRTSAEQQPRSQQNCGPWAWPQQIGCTGKENGNRTDPPDRRPPGILSHHDAPGKSQRRPQQGLAPSRQKGHSTAARTRL